VFKSAEEEHQQETLLTNGQASASRPLRTLLGSGTGVSQGLRETPPTFLLCRSIPEKIGQIREMGCFFANPCSKLSRLA